MPAWKNEELLRRVIRMTAEHFGELPESRPGLDRKVFHMQLALALLDEAADGDDAALVALVEKIIRAPWRRIKME